jgi:predicted nucleic acid-binding protein
MVSAPSLFDTNILVDYLSAVPQARVELDRQADRAISIVTWMEVMAGSADADEQQTRAFLTNFTSLPVAAEVAERAFQIGRERRIKLPGAIVLATAEVSGRVLVTRNTRDLPRGTAGIRVPYSI